MDKEIFNEVSRGFHEAALLEFAESVTNFIDLIRRKHCNPADDVGGKLAVREADIILRYNSLETMRQVSARLALYRMATLCLLDKELSAVLVKEASRLLDVFEKKSS